jgi:hypothetical protein
MVQIVRKNVIMIVLLISSVFSYSGCVVLIAGGLGAVGGYAVSPDTVEGIVDREYLEVWDAAVEVVGIMGTIDDKDEKAGYMLARINGAKVEINILQFTKSNVQMRVKARKTFFPKISVAQEVFVKTMKYLGV